MLFKLSNLNSNLALTLGYLKPALNNWAQGFLIRNAAQGIRNPSSTDKESRIQYLESGIQYLESGIHSVESRIQGRLGLPYMGRPFRISY